jgi:hypothetical protein
MGQNLSKMKDFKGENDMSRFYVDCGGERF